MREGRGQEAEAARRAEVEREKRVAPIAQMSAKRMGNRKLASGWTAWHGGWAEKRRQRQMLATAGARLLRPKLAASLAHWRRDWSREAQRTRGMGEKEQLALARKEHAELEDALREMHDQLEAARADAAEARASSLAALGTSANELEAERERRVRGA